ncbi:MAG TPA: hypothetical protein VGK67_06610 [Myxococcales bacterium]
MNRFGWMAALLALSAPWMMGCPGETPKTECTTAADCATPSNACLKATCESSKCGTANVAAETVIAKQTAGDCIKIVCDGHGKTKSVIDNTDVVDDGNPCTDDKCADGTLTNDPSPAGTDCSASGTGTVCDGNGTCITPSCGNNKAEGTEACDGTDLASKTCVTAGFGGGTLACKSDCTLDTSACTAAKLCGNGALDGAEQCDGTNLNSKTCVTEGFAGGTISCKADCTFDLAACTAGAECGNGALNGTEQCDGANLNSKTCATQGFASGTLACNANCTFNTAACVAANPCGNGILDGAEQCDGANLNSKTCLTQGFAAGTLGCKADCTFDLAGCTAGAECGNGALNGTEQCDGANLNSKTCATQGFASGTLACNANCTFNTAACVAANPCGNGILDGAEQCDGTNLNSKTCATVGGGFTGGTLACKADCTFNTSACTTAAPCGNGTIDGTEQCDGANLNGKTCLTQGFTGGTLGCKADCTFNTAQCAGTNPCGNGTIDGAEQCDLTNLNGKTCATVGGGFTGGTLACKADCTFETAQCTGAPACGIAATLGTVTQVGGSAKGGSAASGAAYVSGQFAFNSDPDGVLVELYAGSGFFAAGLANGTFTLSGAELSYATCSLCVVMVDEKNKTYMPTAGTVTVSSFSGRLTGTLANMAFQEVTINGSTGATTPVANGCQSSMSSMAFDAAIVSTPSTWTCPSSFYGDGTDCDCGCGALDPDCADATVGSCNWCDDEGSCNTAACPGTINPTDNSTCTVVATCGNGTLDAGEDCDGANLNSKTCLTQGFLGGGTLSCGSNCKFVTTACLAAPTCGNGAIDAGEQCDGANLNGKTCLSQGFTGGGSLSCSATCQFVTTACVAAPTCGNGAIDSGEQCDGTLLGGKTCVSINQGFTGGNLGCTNCALNTSGCTTSPVCGNGALETGEACDGTLLGAHTCVTEGFTAGTLSCLPTCALSTANCTGLKCGVAQTLGTVTPVTSYAKSGGATGAKYVVGDFELNAQPDTVRLELYQQATGIFTGGIVPGTFALSGAELQYKTCSLCVRVIDELGKIYMPTGGTVTLAAVGTRLTGTLTNVAFQEVTIAADFTSTPVTPGGCTSNIASMPFDAAINVCGDGAVTGNEGCDGTNFGGLTCASFGYGTGTLTCTASCSIGVNADGTVPGCTDATGETTDAQCLNGTDDNANTWIDCEESACKNSTTNICDSGISWTMPNGTTCTDTCNLLDDCGIGVADLFACNCVNDAGCNGIGSGFRCFTEATSGGWAHAFCGPPCQYLGSTQAARDGWCASLIGTGSTCNATTGACSTVSTTCGNSIVDSGEQCDLLNLNSQTCMTVAGGFTGGTLSCNTNCTFNTTACTTTATTRKDLALFTFEALPAAVTAGPFPAESGTKAATSFVNGFHVGVSTYTSPAGNGSLKSYSSNTWAIGDYYQVTVPATGATDLQVSFDQIRSGTGPTTFKVQWSTDGTNFQDVVASYAVSSTVTWNATTPVTTSSFGPTTLPPAANGAATVYIRLTDTGAPTGTGGTCRVDNIRVTGMTP